jgi:hypothetical protein
MAGLPNRKKGCGRMAGWQNGGKAIRQKRLAERKIGGKAGWQTVNWRKGWLPERQIGIMAERHNGWKAEEQKGRAAEFGMAKRQNGWKAGKKNCGLAEKQKSRMI